MPESSKILANIDTVLFAKLLKERRAAASGRNEPADNPVASEKDQGSAPSRKKTEDLESVIGFIIEQIIEAIQKKIADNHLLQYYVIENPYEQTLETTNSILEANFPDLVIIRIGDRSSASGPAVLKLILRVAEEKKTGIIFLCPSRISLPTSVLALVGEGDWFVVPPMSAQQLAAYIKKFRPDLSLGSEKLDWIRWLRPEHFSLVQRLADKDWLDGLQQLALRQQKAASIGRPVKIDDLIGMDTATNWARSLISDIDAFRQHKIGWAELDRGALLAGPPGTGKTTLGRAIAQEAGVAFISVSVSKDWMSAGSLDDCIKAMTSSFTEARQHHPSILFIDEIDSAGNREKFEGQNATWNTAFLNALLTQFDAMDREEVVVIAATNDPNNVDPALRRSGRLDRLIRIPRPGIEGLSNLYRATLKFFGSTLEPLELQTIAEASLGLTGADVIVMVRGAHRRARHDGNRAIMVDDVLNEIFRIPPTAERHPVNPQQLHITAVHEAGHAIVAMTLPSLRDRVNMISVMPDEAAGIGGFVSIGGTEVAQTQATLRDRICVSLAARVAENMVLGEANTTIGAGGTMADCDLARATRLALQITGIYGFSSHAPDWWSNDGSVAEAQEIIAAERARARKILTQNDAWYQKLVAALVTNHRLSRSEIIALQGVNS